MYRVDDDPYCYPGTTVLKNRLNIRNQANLEAFETLITALRGEEPLPEGRLSYGHYRAIHRHLFQDIFTWAGRLRTVRISKGQSMFCYPEHINSEMKKLFAQLRFDKFLRDRNRDRFASRAAQFTAALNAIHPFREGNGRTQLAFLILLAEKAGHPLAIERMKPQAMLDAMIASFDGNEKGLARLIRLLAI